LVPVLLIFFYLCEDPQMNRISPSKAKELPYFNDGSCVRASGIQGIEIDDGKIMLIEWRVRYDSSGDLHINRRILRGPEPIEKFDLRNNEYIQKEKKNP